MVDPAGSVDGSEPLWERRHPTVPESWSFDFLAPDGSLAGFVGLTIWSGPRLAWYWAALVGRRRPYLLVRDLEVAAPRSPTSREIRSEGLWADINCETPHDHWSLGLEAFGVSLDDPAEALGAERGDRTGLGLDLEWEAAASVVGGEGSYGQACTVHGEILVGGGGGPVETIAFEGHGWRRHAWGGGVDWFGPAWRVDGVLDDGRPWGGGVVDPAAPPAASPPAAPTGPAPPASLAAAATGPSMAAAAPPDLAAAATGPSMAAAAPPDRDAAAPTAAIGADAVSVLHRAPLRLERAGRHAVLERALCRFTIPDARSGLGWSERVVPT